MKLSEILGWEKKECICSHDPITNELISAWGCKCGADIFNTALTSCDREIDREALAKELYLCDYKKHSHLAQIIISTMPTWLKRSEE